MNGYNRCCGKKHGAYAPKMYAMPKEMNKEVCEEKEMYMKKQGMPMHGMPMHGMPMYGMPMGEMLPTPEMMPYETTKPMHHHMQGNVTQVVEPTVYCPNEYHHYNKVEHIIPVVVQNVHHIHTQHEYVVCKEAEQNEVCEYNYGLECEKDVCELINRHHCDPVDPMWY